MPKVALTEQYLEDIADAIRAKNESETLYKPPEMASAILALPAGGGIIPTGTLSITTNGTHNVYNYASANVQVSSTINNQNKTVNPSTSEQSITADSGYTGLGTVTVTAMPTLSLPTTASASATSGYTSKATISRSTSDQYINIGTGYNSAGAYYKVNAVANGTAGTPTATKGAVSSNSVSVTPSVTNTTGYISGGTKTGTAVTVSASELVSGNKAITSNGTNIDVANYATVSVNVGGGGTVNNQDKTVTSSGTLQTVTYDSAQGYTGLGTVTINAAPAATIGVADDYEFTTVSGVRKWNDILTPVANETGWITEGWKTPFTIPYNAVPANTVITPTESTQTVGGYLYMMEGAVTVGAIDSEYVGSSVPRVTATDITVSGPTVTMPSGFYGTELTKTIASGSAAGPSSLSGTSATVSTGTNTLTLTKTGVTTTPTVSAGYVSSATASTATVALTASVTVNPTPTASGATVTIPAGYYSSQTTKSVSSGSASGPSSISDTAATVSTGTNTLTLTKTVSVTPVVSAGYVSSGTATNSSVSLTASVTTKAAATITPGTSNQTIASGTYLTGTQTISGDANLVAGNIKKNVPIFGITGSYEGGGGGTALTVDTATATLSSASASISFTGLAGEPTSFAVVSAAELATGASPWKTAAVVFDGTDLHGQTIRNTSNAQVTYDGSSFSKTYSNGTLTITGSGTNFQANQYKLVYTYGGSDIGTADVQVGSGATSVTFTGLEEEPSYFSCIFKSNFSTSSGYQRVIVVVYDGTSTYGMEMDSSAKHSTAHWTYSYNNGSLTITSSGTNAGGYFHQPGYYQLTYAVEGSSGNYQTKSATYYATSSQQTASISADSGYDALKKVNITIAPVTTTNLIASNIVNGVTVQVGDAADSDRIASITGNVVLQNYYTGSSAPSSATGSNGDLYLQS